MSIIIIQYDLENANDHNNIIYYGNVLAMMNNCGWIFGPECSGRLGSTRKT